MKKLWWLVVGVFLAGQSAVSVMAAGVDGKGGPQAVAAEETKVSKIQLETMRKQEQTRQRNKEMQKLRAKTIMTEGKMTEDEKSKLKVGKK